MGTIVIVLFDIQWYVVNNLYGQVVFFEYSDLVFLSEDTDLIHQLFPLILTYTTNDTVAPVATEWTTYPSLF